MPGMDIPGITLQSSHSPVRITLDTADKLELRGRRTDGEQGQEGLWLVWLVSVGFAAAGGTVLTIAEGRSDRIMGAIFLALGLVILGFGILRSARRERLVLELAERRGRYGTWIWPGSVGEEFCFSFDDVRKIRIRRKIESPGRAHRGPSPTYETWDARLLVKPRRTISLERTKDEDRVRDLASKVAARLGVEIED